MKIAAIVNEFPSLSQTFILSQIKGLVDLGHEVDIFASKRGNVQTLHEDVINYGLMERTCYYKDFYKNMPKNKLVRYFKSMFYLFKWFHKKPKPILRSLNYFKYGREALSLYLFTSIVSFLDKGPYEVIHCHFGPYGNLGVLLKELGVTNGKIITSFHGYDISSYLKAKGKTIYKNLFQKGDLFLPISERWKKSLIEIGCPEERLVVHKMGIDVDKFDFSQRRINKYDKINIISVARLVEKKGIYYGIQSVSRLCAIYPQITYWIVGDGPLKKDLLGLIGDLNVERNIKILGWQPQNKVVELLKRADILLAPSVTSISGDQEGIPVILMEAMAVGLPVVSTFHSGIPELVENWKSGLLVRERDAKALAEKLQYLIENDDMVKNIAREGRRTIVEKYNISVLNSILCNIYKQVSINETKIEYY